MDLVGATIVSAAVTCIVLALQWGGNTKQWDDAAVIAVSCSISIWTHTYLDAVHEVLRHFRRNDNCIRFLGAPGWR